MTYSPREPWSTIARYKRTHHIGAYRALPLETVVGVTVRCPPNVVGFVVPTTTTITMGIIGIIYIIGFIYYLLKSISENYKMLEESDIGPGVTIFMTFITTISFGFVYAMFWPIVYLLEWNNKADSERHE